MMRFFAVMACIFTALEMFNLERSSGLFPDWLLVLAGIGWLFNALYIAIKGTD